MKKLPRIIWYGIGAVVVLVVMLTVGATLLEVNPQVRQEPTWDSPQTKALAQRACYDCHSNETVWPLYAKLPVGAWLTVFDTFRGRRNLNFSEWTSASARGGERGEQGNEVAKVINEGSMPPSYYTILHPDAALTAEEKQLLIQGLQKSLR